VPTVEHLQFIISGFSIDVQEAEDHSKCCRPTRKLPAMWLATFHPKTHYPHWFCDANPDRFHLSRGTHGEAAIQNRNPNLKAAIQDLEGVRNHLSTDYTDYTD
jgi:hypothetical protein